MKLTLISHTLCPYVQRAAIVLAEKGAAFARPGVPLFRGVRADRRGRLFDATAKVRAWRHALAQRPSVQQAVSPQYPALLRQFLRERNAELSRRMLSRG